MARADKVAARNYREIVDVRPRSRDLQRHPAAADRRRGARYGAPARAVAAAYIPTRLGTLAEIDYLRDYDSGIYRDLDLELTLDYMRRRFVAPLARHLDITAATLLDCAVGFRLARLRLSPRRRQACGAGRDGRRRGSTPRARSPRGSASSGAAPSSPTRIQDIDLGEDGVDIFASIETLEHVGRENIRASVRNMARTARRAVVLTTPNFLFPDRRARHRTAVRALAAGRVAPIATPPPRAAPRWIAATSS